MSSQKQDMLQLNKVRVQQLRNVLSACERTNRPVIILGGQGTGKSSVPKQFSEDQDRVVVQVRAAYSMPEDAKGIPVPATVDVDGSKFRVSDNLLPDILAKCWQKHWDTGKKVTLFFDEMNQASPHMMSCLYEVFQDREMNGHKLPDGTLIVAAGNVAKDHGITNDIPFPLINRSALVEFLGPTVDEYKDYMSARNFHAEVQAFLHMNPQWIIDKFAEDSVDGRNPTPRSWEAVSDILKDADEHDTDIETRRLLVASVVGDAACGALTVMMRLRDKMPTVAEIKAAPTRVKIDPEDLPVSYLLALQLIQAVDSVEDLDTIMLFIERIRPEVIGVFLKGLVMDTTRTKYIMKRTPLLNKYKVRMQAGARLNK